MISQAKKFLFMGNSSYSNRGCEAIVRGTMEIFRREFEEVTITSAYFPDQGCSDAEGELDNAIHHNPLRFLPRWSASWFAWQALKRMSEDQAGHLYFRSLQIEADKADAILLVGGDNYSLDYGALSLELHKRVSLFGFGSGKPVVLWGASIGPFSQDKAIESSMARLLNRMALITVRESRSIAYLQSIGVEHNVCSMSDPAFLMHPKPVELPDDVEHLLQRGCVGLNLSPLIGVYGDNGFEDWRKRAPQLISRLHKEIGMPLLLIPHVTSDSGQMSLRDDFLFMNHALQALGNEVQDVLLLGNNYSAEQTKWVISRLKAFAGARMHSAVAAISTCVPTLFIGYSIKAQGMSEDIYGHSDHIIDGRNLDPVVFSKKYKSFIERTDDIRQKLEAVMPGYREKAMHGSQALREVLRDEP